MKTPKSIAVAATLTALAMPVAVLAVAPAHAAPGSGSSTKAPSAKVFAKINKDMVIAKEDKVVVRGRVNVRSKGQKVVLQQRLEGKKGWQKTGASRTNRKGKFVLKDKPTTTGLREYRVLKPRSGVARKAVSKPLETTVYGWERLNIYGAGAKENVLHSAASIGAEHYWSTIGVETPGTPGFVEFTLGRKCVALEATYALSDLSATGSTGAITVVADGAQKAAYDLSVGQINEDQVTDVTDVFRLRFNLASSAEPVGHPVVADPRALCTR